MNEHTANHCAQEPRLIHLEAALAGIDATLKDVKDLLRSSIQADERIATLSKDAADQEERLRTLELALASARWQERVVWVIVAAALTMFLKHYG